jgi:hypothetical protein
LVKYDVAYILNWLVVTGTMEFYDFPYIGNVIIPTDEVQHFSEGLKLKTTNQMRIDQLKMGDL